MKYKYIRREWLARELYKQGFKLVKIINNRDNPIERNYIFEYTPKIDAALVKAVKYRLYY